MFLSFFLEMQTFVHWSMFDQFWPSIVFVLIGQGTVENLARVDVCFHTGKLFTFIQLSFYVTFIYLCLFVAFELEVVYSLDSVSFMSLF